MSEDHKICRYCKLKQPIENFNSEKSRFCKSCIKEKERAYYHKNSAKINARRKGYLKQTVAQNPNFYKERYQRRKENPSYKEQKRDSERRRKAKKRKNDLNFKILECLRSRMIRALSGKRKSYKTIDLIGCSIEFFLNYIESKWLTGMTWENHGSKDDNWQIDHVIPCAAFDLTKPEEQKLCFHYTNLQPLWKQDNKAKNDKMPDGSLGRYHRVV